MAKQTLTFRFHDPNPAAETAEHLARLFAEVNQHQIEQILREASSSKRSPSQPAGAL